jgi:hypothetical protein
MPLAALVVLAAGMSFAGEAPASIRPTFEALRTPELKEISRLEARLASTLTGRRLLAETVEVPHSASIAGLDNSAAVKYLRSPAVFLAFDPERFAGAGEDELELAFVREFAKAAMDIPVPLVEAEMAAIQTELYFALEKADNEPAFARKLASAVKKRREELSQFQDAEPAGALFPPPMPDGEFARAAFFMALFERGPDLFYWTVQRDLAPSPPMVRLTDLEDFYGRFGPGFSGARESHGTPWVRMSGRRYPFAWLASARRLVDPGGLGPIHEALGAFEEEPARELVRRIDKRLSRRP